MTCPLCGLHRLDASQPCPCKTAAPLANPGDIIYAGKVVPRWSLRWIWAKLWFAFIDMLDWFRSLSGYWYGFRIGRAHGTESPGCVFTPFEGPRIVLRFDEVRGEYFYCNVCLRPLTLLRDEPTDEASEHTDEQHRPGDE